MKVLIVDDEGDFVEMTVLRLQREGYMVDVALTGQHGIAKASDFQPDVILLDLVMPQLDGWEVCRQLETNPKTSAIPIILVTAARPRDIEGMIQKTTVAHVLYKPFEQKTLLATLREVTV
ncbi:MAG: response regulator, partial [Deltaproteobacteria bacterium]|nr:response regulator [Deltaproteobacteria bacterium]